MLLYFFTPEYNRSFPGVLKNAIDYSSRPYGQNSWDSKPAAVISVSLSDGATANNALKMALAYHNMPLMSQPELYVPFNDGTISNGQFADETTEEFAKLWMHAFVEFVEHQAA